MKYKQTVNFRITGPGLPRSGSVAIGVHELEAAYQAGVKAEYRRFYLFGPDETNSKNRSINSRGLMTEKRRKEIAKEYRRKLEIMAKIGEPRKAWLPQWLKDHANGINRATLYRYVAEN